MKKVEEEHEVLEPLNRIVDEQQVGAAKPLGAMGLAFQGAVAVQA